MLSMEPRLGNMVREPYDSSTASHREYTDSTLQKQEGFVISGEPETADIRSEFALAIAGEILDEGDDDGKEFTGKVARELVKSSSKQTSSQVLLYGFSNFLIHLILFISGHLII